MPEVPKQIFDGIRVLDAGHIVAGPIAGTLLADFGADVIKIEPPTGDPLRWNSKKNGVGLFYKVEARNKRCITLNLKHPRGRELFHQLVAVSDVLIENFRPGVMERLGNDWDTLRSLNPRLVFCRLSSWGQTGPYASRRSYGRVAEAFAGFAHLTGDPQGTPMHSAMSLGDSVAGLWAAMAIAMGLYWRDARGGVGQVIDVALYEPLFRLIEQQIIVYDQLGTALRRIGNDNPGDPFVGLYQTKEGGYYSFSAATGSSILDLLRAVGLDQDPRFNTYDACLDHRDEFRVLVADWMQERTLPEVRAAFDRYEAAGTPVMSAEDLCHDPHVQAREMVVTVNDDELGAVRMQGIVPKFSETPGNVRHAGQRLGASNKPIYCGLLGLSPQDLQDLASQGVI